MGSTTETTKTPHVLGIQPSRDGPPPWIPQLDHNFSWRHVCRAKKCAVQDGESDRSESRQEGAETNEEWTLAPYRRVP